MFIFGYPVFIHSIPGDLFIPDGVKNVPRVFYSYW